MSHFVVWTPKGVVGNGFWVCDVEVDHAYITHLLMLEGVMYADPDITVMPNFTPILRFGQFFTPPQVTKK